jgi:hypothetical protein
MRCSRLVVVAALVVTGAAAGASAQTRDAMSPLEIVTACAPPLTIDAPHPLRVIGSQDPAPRALFGDRDLLVVGGGTAAGVQVGQRYFVRRDVPLAPSTLGRGPKTLGVLRIVAVNESTAIASVDQLCNGILITDYLDPFVPPAPPADAVRTETPGQPDFTAMARVRAGTEDRSTLGQGDFAMIDWGAERGLAAGTRFAIYRDVGIGGLPMVSIGEGIVISAVHNVALTRITRARDVVFVGDYVAIRR